MIWSPRGLDQLITSPKEALNVFDFEPVMAKNVPPAHFGFMATGTDEEETLRANREGFKKFVLRPRRLVDVSKPDTSFELFGTNMQPRSASARPAATRPFTPTARPRSPMRRSSETT